MQEGGVGGGVRDFFSHQFSEGGSAASREGYQAI